VPYYSGGGYIFLAFSESRRSIEYNKMSATLYFDYLYTADAAQTTTLTVSGEAQDAMPSGVTGIDETIVVNVSAGELNGLMVVGAQGNTAGFGYPSVTLDWSAITSAPVKWVSFLTVGATGVAPVDFQDGVPSSKPTLQKVFATEPFKYDTNAENLLLTIPPEAIQNVNYAGPISLKRGASVLSADAMAGAAGILGESVTAGTEAELSDSQEAAVRGLFLQALAAGKYLQSGAKAPDGSDLPADASMGFDFKTGDVIKLYTVLSLTKTRSFIPATDDATVEGTTGMKFTVDGTQIVVDGTNDTVASDVKQWRVEWQLKVGGGAAV